jgi:membrane-associated phospholipid phosphatase
MFSPKAIAAPIFLMTYHFGINYSIYYVIAITGALLITTFTKRIFRRDRPKPRNNLTLKPMYFRSLETNFSFPSGDSAQAGVFAFFYL